MSNLLKQIKLAGNSVPTTLVNVSFDIQANTFGININTYQATIGTVSPDITIQATTANIPIVALASNISYIEINNILCNTYSATIGTYPAAVTMFTDYQVAANTAQQVLTTYQTTVSLVTPAPDPVINLSLTEGIY